MFMKNRSYGMRSKTVAIILAVVMAVGTFVVFGMPERAYADSSANWIDMGSEFVYTTQLLPIGDDDRDYTPVSSSVNLQTAINAASAYDVDKPYVIYINTTFAFSSTVAIAGKNVELRATSAGTNIDLTVEGNFRHFNITSANSKLVLTDITLNGGIDYEASKGNSTYTTGGINISNNSSLIFKGNITRCRYSIAGTNGGGGAIYMTGSGATKLTVLGGILSNNITTASDISRAAGGAIGGYYDFSTNHELEISGDTQIIDNWSRNYGGGIAFGGKKLKISDDVKIIGNSATLGGGAEIRYATNVDISGNVEFKDNYTRDEPRGSQMVYPGNGGAISYIIPTNLATSVGNLTISDDVKFTNNTAVRGGGAIALGYADNPSTASLTLNGATFTGNKALGTTRELAANADIRDVQSIGGGGAIYAFDRTKVNIPSDSTATFSGNWSPFTTFIDYPHLTGAESPQSIAGDNYVSHIETRNTGNSLTTNSLYNHLYNNYDIGVRAAEVTNPSPDTNSYSKFALDIGTGGAISQPSNQYSKFKELSAGEQYLGLGEHVQFTAVPDNGYVFKGWTSVSGTSTSTDVPTTRKNWLNYDLSNTLVGYDATTNPYKAVSVNGDIAFSSDPTLVPSEWDTAVTDISVDGKTLSLTMPNTDVRLSPRFVTEAKLSQIVSSNPVSLASHEFQIKRNGSSYGAGDVTTDTITLKNSGTWTAANLGLALGDDTNFTLTRTDGGDDALDTDEEAVWTLAPVLGLDAGTYSTTLTLTYGNGNRTVSEEVKVSVTVSDLEVPVIMVNETPAFANQVEGYSNATLGKDIHVTNVGSAAATDISAALLSSSPNFEISGAGGALNVIAAKSWTVRPKAGLSAGSYNETVRITYTGLNIDGASANGSRTIDIPVSFTVAAPASIAAGIGGAGTWTAGTKLFTFTSQDEGYIAPPTALITLTNSGGTAGRINSIVASSGDVTAFSIPNFSTADSNVPAKEGSANGQNAAYTISPARDLAPKTAPYAATFTVSYDDGTSVAKTFTFDVRYSVNAVNSISSVRATGSPSNALEVRFANKWRPHDGVLLASDIASLTGATVLSGGNIYSSDGGYTWVIPITATAATAQISITAASPYSGAAFTASSPVIRPYTITARTKLGTAAAVTYGTYTVATGSDYALGVPYKAGYVLKTYQIGSGSEVNGKGLDSVTVPNVVANTTVLFTYQTVDEASNEDYLDVTITGKKDNGGGAVLFSYTERISKSLTSKTFDNAPSFAPDWVLKSGEAAKLTINPSTVSGLATSIEVYYEKGTTPINVQAHLYGSGAPIIPDTITPDWVIGTSFTAPAPSIPGYVVVKDDGSAWGASADKSIASVSSSNKTITYFYKVDKGNLTVVGKDAATNAELYREQIEVSTNTADKDVAPRTITNYGGIASHAHVAFDGTVFSASPANGGLNGAALDPATGTLTFAYTRQTADVTLKAVNANGGAAIGAEYIISGQRVGENYVFKDADLDALDVKVAAVPVSGIRVGGPTSTLVASGPNVVEVQYNVYSLDTVTVELHVGTAAGPLLHSYAIGVNNTGGQLIEVDPATISFEGYTAQAGTYSVTTSSSDPTQNVIKIPMTDVRKHVAVYEQVGSALNPAALSDTLYASVANREIVPPNKSGYVVTQYKVISGSGPGAPAAAAIAGDGLTMGANVTLSDGTKNYSIIFRYESIEDVIKDASTDVTVYSYLYDGAVTTTPVVDAIVFSAVRIGQEFRYQASAIPGYTLVGTNGAALPDRNGIIPAVAAGSADRLTFYYKQNSLPAFITKPPAAANVYKGAALSTSLLSGGMARSADGGVAGVFSWDSGGDVLNVSGEHAVTFTPNNAQRYLTDTTSVNVTVLDKGTLDSDLASAGSALAGAVVGTEIGQHPQSAYDDFAAAIASAQAIADKAAANNSQAAIDIARAALEAAVTAFETAKFVSVPVSVSIQFDLNYAGAPAGPAGISVVYGTDYASGGGLPAPVRSGFTFDGWNTQKDGKGVTVAATTKVTVATASQTLYAQWTAGKGDPVPVTSVKIAGSADETYEYCVHTENTRANTVTVLPADADNNDVAWATSDPGVASVNQSGLVTFNGKEGTVTLTATAKDGSALSDSKVYKVVKHVTAIRTALNKVNISVKKKVSIVPVLEDGGIVITGSKITYTSSNPKTAKVDAKGTVTGVKAGKAVVTVATANGESIKVNVAVVKKAVKLKKFTLSGIKKGKLSLKAGKAKVLKIKLTPAKATNLKVSFKSSKKGVATVDAAGMITAVKKGKAIITVKVGGKTVKVKLAVK